MLEGSYISTIAPTLVALVPARRRCTRTVAAALLDRTWILDIQGSLGLGAILEYIDVWQRLQHIMLTSQPDIIQWRWTENGIYLASSCYSALFTGSMASEHWPLVWKSGAPMSVKFFLYLASMNR